MKQILLLVALVSVSITNKAQSPEEIVKLFGDNMNEWCETGDVSFRIKLNKIVGGEKKCLVDDKVMDWIAANDENNLIPKTGTREIASYLNGFEEKLVNKTTFSLSNFIWDKNFKVPDALEDSRNCKFRTICTQPFGA